MRKEEAIAGIDIGTTKVVVVVGQIQEGMIQITGIGKAPNSGMRKGAVSDVEDTVSAISQAVEEAERSSGTELGRCFTSVSGPQIISADSKGVVAISRSDGQVQESDLERVTDSAKSVALPPNYEILHIIPRGFTIDNQTGIRDPVGMSGIRLETVAHVIGIPAPIIRNLSKAITQAGIDIEGVVFSPVAAAKAYLNKKQKEIGVILVDIGAASTSLAVFEEGSLIHTKVIPIGSSHITNDIAIGLKISLESAEQIKLNEVTTQVEEVREGEKINLSKYEQGEKERPNKRFVCEIAEARLNELFSLIKDELKAIERDEMLPAGAILVGGGAKFDGARQFAKNTLNLPCQIGRSVFEVSGIVDKLDDPEYATAVGLLLWGIDESQNIVSNKTKLAVGSDKLGEAAAKIKGFFKNFIP